MRLVIPGKYQDLPELDVGTKSVGEWSIQGCKGPGNYGMVDHGRWAEEITVALLFLLREMNRDHPGPPLEIDDVNDEDLIWIISQGDLTMEISGKEIQASLNIDGTSVRKNLHRALEEIILRKINSPILH